MPTFAFKSEFYGSSCDTGNGDFAGTLRTDDGVQYECRIKGSLRLKRGIKSTNPVAVGDRVEFSTAPDGTDGVVTRILPRRNFIVRRSVKLSKRTHILASNIDTAFIVATISSPQTTTTFIDRFLATARAYRIPAVVLFNKTDIYGPEDTASMEALSLLYEKIGYPVLRISAATGENIGELKKMMAGRTSDVFRAFRRREKQHNKRRGAFA